MSHTDQLRALLEGHPVGLALPDTPKTGHQRPEPSPFLLLPLSRRSFPPWEVEVPAIRRSDSATRWRLRAS